jgi:hypothetical protein
MLRREGDETQEESDTNIRVMWEGELLQDTNIKHTYTTHLFVTQQ